MFAPAWLGSSASVGSVGGSNCIHVPIGAAPVGCLHPKWRMISTEYPEEGERRAKDEAQTDISLCSLRGSFSLWRVVSAQPAVV